MEKASVKGEVAIAVPFREKEMLILKRSSKTSSSGIWAFPGGKIEADEEASEAALRELEEETGLKGEIVQIGESYVDEGELGEWMIYPFLVNVESSEVELNYEHSEHRWMTKNEIEEMNTLGELKALKILDVPE